MTTEITLNFTEMRMACDVAIGYAFHNMQVGAKEKGCADRFDHSIGIGILGMLGEMAVAKHLGIYWSGNKVGDYKSPDVGAFQVRTTIHNGGHLRVEIDDNPEEKFILISAKPPLFKIHGWFYGREAQHGGKDVGEFWCSKTPDRFAFWVPAARLHRLEDLKT